MSGQPGCYLEGNDHTTEQPTSTSTVPESTTDSGGSIGEYLFVVGSGWSTRRKTEIVSLTEDDSIPNCLDALSDHPNELYYAAGGALPDAGYLPHTCGSYFLPEDECWVYTPSKDTWMKTSTIPRSIDSVASTFHPAWGIIMSGGTPSYAEVTITEDAKSFEDLEPMPYNSIFHCVVAVDKNTIFCDWFKLK